MTAIRMLVGVSGSDFSWRPGQVLDLPEAEAAAWADGERAVYLDPPADTPAGPPVDGADGQPPPEGSHEHQPVDGPAGQATPAVSVEAGSRRTPTPARAAKAPGRRRAVTG
jgi:hypothetical protein